MGKLTLVIANKNYSSWSLRAWLYLKHTGAPFEEVGIGLDEPSTREQIARYSPSGRVPVLMDGPVTVWDSLAICEYLSERVHGGRGWPADPAHRAHARSIAAEMHAGFQALRSEMPMNIRARRRVSASAAARADIARVQAIWTECRERHGSTGPWLYGEFSIADAMYAPVVSRFNTYGVGLSGPAAEYSQTVLECPAMVQWSSAGREDSRVVPSDEAGTPP